MRRVRLKVLYLGDVLMTAKHLETLTGKDGGVPLVILKRTKDEEANKKTFSDITDTMKASGVATEITRVTVEICWHLGEG